MHFSWQAATSQPSPKTVHIHTRVHTHRAWYCCPSSQQRSHLPLVDVLPPFPASSSRATRDFMPSLSAGGSPSKELHLRASCLHLSQKKHKQLAGISPGAGQAGFSPRLLLLQMGSRSTQCPSRQATGQWVEMSSMGSSFRGYKPYFFLQFASLALVICSAKMNR